MENRDNVLKVVEDYINSAYESNGATTRKIFDDDAKVTGHINGKLIRQTKEDWAIFVEKNTPSPKEQGKTKAYEILMVDAGEETAVVKVKSEYIGFMFIDTLSLLKVDNDWKIYNKVFESIS
jgi:hypothetical protein